MKKEILINFSFSYGKLKQLCDNILQLIDRDQVEFAESGFTPTKRAAFQNQIDAFVAIPSDEVLDGIKQSTTQVKDEARQELEIAMRSIISKVAIVFKKFPGKQAEFGSFDLTRQSDEELVRNAKTIKDSATKYLVELAEEGLTIEKINDLATKNEAFDLAIDLQRKAINERNTITETRRIEANRLYDLLTENSNRGKGIFQDVSHAKYNDYIIYNTPSGENPEQSPTDVPVN